MYNESVPEISRFFGIIVRMFAEAGSPHQVAHFHAYYQDEVGIFSIDPIELIEVRYPGGRGASWKRGLSCIRVSSGSIGSGCRKAVSPRPSNH